MSPEEATQTIQSGKMSSRSIPVPRPEKSPSMLGYTSEDPAESLFWGKTSLYKKLGKYPEQVHVGQFDENGNLLRMMQVKTDGKIVSSVPKIEGVVTRAPDKLPTAGNVGEYLNTLESQIDNGTINTAQAARDAYAGTKYINSNPNIVGKSNEISVQSARVGAKAQALLNKFVPGRGEPAAEMARVMQVPNAIGKVYNKVPPTVRRTVIPIAVIEEYMRRKYSGR